MMHGYTSGQVGVLLLGQQSLPVFSCGSYWFKSSRAFTTPDLFRDYHIQAPISTNLPSSEICDLAR